MPTYSMFLAIIIVFNACQGQKHRKRLPSLERPITKESLADHSQAAPPSSLAINIDKVQSIHQIIFFSPKLALAPLSIRADWTTPELRTNYIRETNTVIDNYLGKLKQEIQVAPKNRRPKWSEEKIVNSSESALKERFQETPDQLSISDTMSLQRIHSVNEVSWRGDTPVLVRLSVGEDYRVSAGSKGPLKEEASGQFTMKETELAVFEAANQSKGKIQSIQLDHGQKAEVLFLKELSGQGDSVDYIFALRKIDTAPPVDKTTRAVPSKITEIMPGKWQSSVEDTLKEVRKTIEADKDNMTAISTDRADADLAAFLREVHEGRFADDNSYAEFVGEGFTFVTQEGGVRVTRTVQLSNVSKQGQGIRAESEEDIVQGSFGSIQNLIIKKQQDDGPIETKVFLSKYMVSDDGADTTAAQMASKELAVMSAVGESAAAHVHGMMKLDRNLSFIFMEKGSRNWNEAVSADSTSDTMRLQLTKDLNASMLQLHRQGVSHGDLKGGNVVIFERGGRQTARLIDLGSARQLGDVGFEGGSFHIGSLELQAKLTTETSDLAMHSVMVMQMLYAKNTDFQLRVRKNTRQIDTDRLKAFIDALPDGRPPLGMSSELKKLFTDVLEQTLKPQRVLRVNSEAFVRRFNAAFTDLSQ